MKRVSIFVITLLMVFSITGCGKNKPTETVPEATPVPVDLTPTAAAECLHNEVH